MYINNKDGQLSLIYSLYLIRFPASPWVFEVSVSLPVQRPPTCAGSFLSCGEKLHVPKVCFIYLSLLFPGSAIHKKIPTVFTLPGFLFFALITYAMVMV